MIFFYMNVKYVIINRISVLMHSRNVLKITLNTFFLYIFYFHFVSLILNYVRLCQLCFSKNCNPLYIFLKVSGAKQNFDT